MSCPNSSSGTGTSSCTNSSSCTCGCCAGTSVQAPAGESNLPGLSAIVYRTGTWATFKESMLARLSSSDYPALSLLKTRDDDDFTIAFLDASAVVMDILTFYQERLANESYLRTAVQLRSLTELSRLIGYQPAPGIASSVYLAFTLKATSGQPTNLSTPTTVIPAGTQVQSVAAQGQTAQTFETFAAIAAKPDWNALPVQTGNPWAPAVGDTSLYLAGTATQLNPGDSILLVGSDRGTASNPLWEVHILTAATADTINNRTLITWTAPLVNPPTDAPKVYALRQRASLFGYNSLNPLMLAAATITLLHNHHLLNAAKTEWNFLVDGPDGNTLASDSLVDLDAVYSKIADGSWLVLSEPVKSSAGAYSTNSSLYRIQTVSTVSRSSFSLSGKTSRLLVDTSDGLKDFYNGTRSVAAFAQSEQLPAADTPLLYPLYGTYLDLEVVRPDLTGAQVVAVTGNSQKLIVNPGVSLIFRPDDGTKSLTLKPGDVITLTDPTPLTLNANGSTPDWSPGSAVVSKHRTLLVMDPSGRPGSIKHARLSDFTLALAASSDPVVQECALVGSVTTVGTPPRTRIILQNNLLHCYDRTAATVNVNVGLATAGASVTEIMGNGAAATPNQDFTLRQKPLTYIQAPTPTGRQSTLQVTANAVTWTEVPSLYEEPPTAQVFSVLNQAATSQAAGSADVLFGDGVEGATLPTGQNNIQATYRVGSGASGNVASGSITTLIDRPLGVSGVVNPQAATGGADPQSIDGIRTYAPQSVLTLGRVVSITDYQSYAATFAGIAQASALWIPAGPARGVFLTVAAAGGSALVPGNPTLVNLTTSLQNYGNPLVPITVVSFLETLFRLSADVKYDPSYSQPNVKAAIVAALTQNYSFAARPFGQGVSADEIAADIQAIPGVIAVNVKHLRVGPTSAGGDLASISGSYSVSAYNTWITQPVTLTRPDGGALLICPYIPAPSVTAGVISAPQPAEILVIDPDPTKIVLGVMQ